MYKILIVEDDEDILSSLKETLEIKDYQVITACNYKEALLNMNSSIDLIIMDIQLPDGNGIVLCKKIRENYKTPLIFLTCKNDEETIVEGLNAGGDDYVCKPFGIKELYARINSILRRVPVNSQYIFTGDLKVDKTCHKIYKKDDLLDISIVIYYILLTLIEANGVVITRDHLMEVVERQTHHFIEDNTLSVHMKRLRNILGKYNDAPYIETVRGVGYRWNL
jgi:DNA-binding response OmpR family regulator